MVAFLQYAGGGIMTPEEQFMKIENALRHAAEIQAQHAEAIAQHAGAIAQDQAAIRDLIAVSRTLLDTAKLHSEQIAASNVRLNDVFDRAEEERRTDRKEFDTKLSALLQAQVETEQKLQRWIDRQGHG